MRLWAYIYIPIHRYTYTDCGKCRKWRRQRDIPRASLQSVGIRWPLNPGRQWVAEVMGNDKAIKPLIDYLGATEVGGREGADKRSEEWGDRVDREGEDELGSE